MTDGLKDAHREAIIATLAANDRVERAVLFGSRATGTNTVSSDVDIALFGDRLTLTDQARLAAVIDEIPMAQSVDLLLYDSLQDRTLREHIWRQGVEWYARTPRHAGSNIASEYSSEWPVVTVANLSEKVAMGPFGSSIKVSTFVPDGVPIISGQHLHGVRIDETPGFNFITHEHAQRLANANVRRGDVIFTHRGNIGQVSYIPEDSQFERYIVSQSQFYVRCDKTQAVPEFIALYFTSAEGQHQLLANTSQVGVPSIAQPVTYLRTLQVPLPPLSEQRTIAHILGTLDDKIELNRRMNATLEAMARALFRSWFVDFDPVRAMMEGRDTGLPKEIADLFPDRLVDSELGGIPEGWDVATLGDISEVIDCLHSKKPDRTPEGKPLLQLWNIQDNGLTDMSDTYFINEGDYERWTSRIEVREGDCVITNVGRVGAVSQIPPRLHAALGRNMTAVRCIAGFGYPTFVIAALLSDAMRWEIALKTDSGTILNALNVRSIPKLRFVRAPELVLAAHERIARPMRARMEANLETSRTLAALRDKLLPKLVSGELRVSASGPAFARDGRPASVGAHQA